MCKGDYSIASEDRSRIVFVFVTNLLIICFEHECLEAHSFMVDLSRADFIGKGLLVCVLYIRKIIINVLKLLIREIFVWLAKK